MKFENIIEYTEYVKALVKEKHFETAISQLQKELEEHGMSGVSRMSGASEPQADWEWLEPHALYLITNSSGDVFLVYGHPYDMQYLWWVSLDNYQTPETIAQLGIEIRDYNKWDMSREEVWAHIFWKLSNIGLSLGIQFINWLEVKPLEVK